MEAEVTQQGAGKRGRGRPPLLEEDPAVAKTIVEAVRVGCYQSVACVAAGVSYKTLMLWKRKGEREPDSIYGHFLAALKDAQARAELDAIELIKKAAFGGYVLERRTTTRELKNGTVLTETYEKVAPPEWAAMAWFLERSHPDRWGRRDRITWEFDRMAELLAQREGMDADELKRDARALAGELQQELEEGVGAGTDEW